MSTWGKWITGNIIQQWVILWQHSQIHWNDVFLICGVCHITAQSHLERSWTCYEPVRWAWYMTSRIPHYHYFMFSVFPQNIFTWIWKILLLRLNWQKHSSLYLISSDSLCLGDWFTLPKHFGTVNHFGFFRIIYLTKILFVVAKPNAPCLYTITIPLYSAQNGVPFYKLQGVNENTSLWSTVRAPTSPIIQFWHFNISNWDLPLGSSL